MRPHRSAAPDLTTAGMSRWLIAVSGAALLFTVAAYAAQSSSDAQPLPKGVPKTVTLTGCVEQGATPNTFTLTDPQSGKFEVRGNRIGRYLGQRVEIAGSQDTGRLKIRGGLTPTPNAAAQRGAMDPVRAAMDGLPGGPSAGTGDIALPTFRVRSVKTLSGGCG